MDNSHCRKDDSMKKVIALVLLLLNIFNYSASKANTQSDYETVVAQRDALYQQLINLGVQPCIEIEGHSSDLIMTNDIEEDKTIASTSHQDTNVPSEKADRSISILTEELTVPVGKQLQIKAEIIRNSEDAPSKSTIQWSAVNEDMVKISSTGMVTGIAPGEAKILCTLADNPEIKELVTIHVIQPVKKIKAHTSQITLLYGASSKASKGRIDVIVSPENATDQTCLYSSSDESIVTVDAEGNLQAVAPGKARITILPSDGSPGVRTVCNVTVGQAVTAVSIPASQTISKKKTFVLKPEVLPNNATQKKLEYSSSNPEVAKVSSNGIVTAVECGTATITARSTDGSEISSECTVTVIQMVQSIKLDKKNVTLDYYGFEQLSATVFPEDATDKTVRWESSNRATATVTHNGMISALSPGTTTITCYAKDGSGVKSTVTVKVLEYQSKTKNGSISNGVPLGEPTNLAYNVENMLRFGNVDVRSYTVQKLDNGFFRFTMKYVAPSDFNVYVFSPPEGEFFGFYARKKTSSEEETVRFEIHKDDLYRSRFVTVLFSDIHSGDPFYVGLKQPFNSR